MVEPRVTDALFESAEQLASDFSLFPQSTDTARFAPIEGLIAPEDARRQIQVLRSLAVDEYVERCVLPSEDPGRAGVRAIVRRLGWQTIRELEFGPLYGAEVRATVAGQQRRIGVLAQDRTQNNGAWLPEHHLRAVEVIRDLAVHSVPIVTFIDTPGADSGEIANRNNQAHSISRLIAEMAQIHVPVVGVILGNGYSGGAIPLATANILLSVSDGVFNTIQPRGLANIARKYNLSWQECAQAVGVSAYELFEQGYLDGVVDYTPDRPDDNVENLGNAITSSIAAVEELATRFVRDQPAVFEHYRRTVSRFLDPSERLRRQQSSDQLSTLDNPTHQPNLFGVAYRYVRYLGMRRRLRSTNVQKYGRLSDQEIPSGDLARRQELENRSAFERWLESPLHVRYDVPLNEAWKAVVKSRVALDRDRGRVATFLFGSRQQNLVRDRKVLTLELAFYLYNLWKSGAQHNVAALLDYLEKDDSGPAPPDASADVLQIVSDPDVRQEFADECRNLLLFDLLYDRLIQDLKSVAREAMETNKISKESVGRLLEASLGAAVEAAQKNPIWNRDGVQSSEEDLRDALHKWIRRLGRHRRRAELLKAVADWKKAAYPQVSEPLFGLITFFFDRLLQNYYYVETFGGRYDGSIRPRNIGIKDFWSRLDRAYKDLLLQEVLTDVKRRERVLPKMILNEFFDGVDELNSSLMTSDPVSFPGFRLSIEQALDSDQVPCGVVTALAHVEVGGTKRRVGVMVSNLGFQAGSFDMASGEKFCKLLVRCARRRLPVFCFVTSGGMQTKEGAGALFSMSVVNDRITRFVRDHDLPIVMFGFGDCTGGAQASMVTHPLVENYYFSGTNMPFAGQIVTPSHLPLTSTLSNYLSETPGAMTALVRHPFASDLDERLYEIDPEIPVPELSVEQVIERVLEGKAPPDEEVSTPAAHRSERNREKTFRPVNKVLIHGRGCTAVKLVNVAQQRGIDVVLVQSDPDMESTAARALRGDSTLVCLGGSTPDESYLNAHSVIRIAETEGADSLHPGIGFLSESASFADLCARHDLNFVGPSVEAMEWMGNKSNAVQTATRLGVPVVPGSHGVVTSPAAAREVAQRVGFPVMIKAVHGGGGRGIRRVDEGDDFEEIFLRMGTEAANAFGSRDLYLERCVQRFRHVEVQVLRDSNGNVLVPGYRDCSVQRNHQKVVEESANTHLPEERKRELYSYAERLANEVGYIGAGTVEFMYDLDRDELYFMEMNTRLQIEHPVTEKSANVDIVGAQFDIAAGGSIAGLQIEESGFAVEVRVNAERLEIAADGSPSFRPDPGQITRCDYADIEGVDILSAIDDGISVSPFYDSMVAQVIVHEKDRDAALDKLVAFLKGTRIEGVGTNIPLLLRILDDPEFRRGEHDTAYMARLLSRLDLQEIASEIDEAAGQAGGIDRATIEIEDSSELKVVAQSQGIFYSSPSPGKPDFVQVGEHVSGSHVLCLIEAMKLFQEVSLASFNSESELYPMDQRYEVVRVNPEDGQLVNQGDLLFVVRPIAA
ncbi:MAG: biotin carboxylase N-terminal domain-containing protein [Acidobacteriota bacterium]